MSSRVTQCPKCQTSFRVTDAQLEIASGSVRCGSCLHIFNALEHPVTAKASIAKQDNIDLEASFDEPLDDDDFLIDDNADISELFDDGDDDFDDLLEDTDQHQAIDNKKQARESELSESFLEVNNWEKKPSAVFKELDDFEDEDDDSEAWATKLLEDDENEPLPDSEAVKPSPSFDLSPELLESSVKSIDDDDETTLDPELLELLNEAPEKPYSPYETADLDSDETDADNFSAGSFSAGERIGSEAKSHNQLLNSIEPEPVEITAKKTKKQGLTFLWQMLTAMALMTLPLQYIYHNFDVLARDQGYRPWFQKACEQFGCRLPALHDIQAIQSSNLIVRSHPNTKNALVVDAIITNRAQFTQAFPKLELSFSDIHGQIVAGRAFQPEEYLAGELLGSKLMPNNQPIHISLAIIDPGSAAVNYQIRILPNL